MSYPFFGLHTSWPSTLTQGLLWDPRRQPSTWLRFTKSSYGYDVANVSSCRWSRCFEYRVWHSDPRPAQEPSSDHVTNATICPPPWSLLKCLRKQLWIRPSMVDFYFHSLLDCSHQEIHYAPVSFKQNLEAIIPAQSSPHRRHVRQKSCLRSIVTVIIY